MPGYQMFEQSGTWAPGGAGRLYVNPQQRPGISDGQLAVARNIISPVQLRGCSCMGEEGLGCVPLIAAAVGVVGSVAVPLVQKKLAEKKAKKAAAKEKKRAEEEARKEAEEEEKKAAAAALVGSTVSGSKISSSAGTKDWTPFIIGGGAILAALLFFSGGKKR